MANIRKPRNPELVRRAKQLRKEATASEKHLWNFLSSHRFSEIKFRRQHLIEPIIVDFYCTSKQLVIEIDGSVHDDPAVIAKDLSRQHWLESHGHRVIRFRSDEVEQNVWKVLATIASECGVDLKVDI